MPSRNSILVFTKFPRPGRVKTRLIGALTPQQAAEVHSACLEDTLALAARVPECERALLVASSLGSARRLAQRLRIGRGWRIGAQGRGDLGQHLARAFRVAFRSRAEKVVVLGTDTPWMTRGRIQQALRLLSDVDVVLGPTEDGGYYLVAMRREVPEMFRGIPWGTARVLQRTVAALGRAKIPFRLLARDFDLDTPADLRRAARLLRRSQRVRSALKGWVKRWSAASESSRRQRPARRSRRPRPGQA